MRKKIKELIFGLSALIIAISLIFSYAGDYYSSEQKSSSDYVIFATVFYTASHLFCEDGYDCTFSNLTFSEFQKKELQKYQDQIDWTKNKADTWNGRSSQLLWIALILNLIGIYFIWKSK